MSIHEIRNGVMRLVRLPLRARRDIDADADAELRSFLAERVESLRAQGMSDTDAEREALRRLGSSLDDATHLLHHSARSRERRMNMRELYDDFTQDLHYAIRTLRRDLRFAVFAIVIVGLGIGASVTVFSVANAMLIRPLPFTNPDRLVWMPNSEAGGLSGQTSQVNSVLRVMENNQSFDAISGYFAFSSAGDTKLLEKGQVVRLSGLPVMRNFFDVLGVKPLLGRGFTQEEATGKGPAAVMLSHSLWSVRYNADPQIVGKSLVLGGNPTTIVGVLPESFNFGAVFVPGTHIDLFTPFPMEERQNGWGNTLSLVGRLKAGVTPAAASAELKVIAARLLVENPRMNTFKPRAIALREHVSGTVRSALIVLTLAVGVVMLIVCANLSNLLLARATTRQKEMAVRVALGAGRARLVRQMLTESVVLSACGTVLGLLLAVAGTRVIASLDGINLPMLSEVRIDLAAVGIATLLALVAGIAFGLVPALQIPSGAVHGALKESTRNATGGSRGKVARSSLVISEIALACVLLVGAGLLTRSFFKVLDIDMGFKAQQVASIRVDPTSTQTGTAEAFTAYVDEVLRVVRETPGVVAAGLSDGLPLTGNRSWGVAARESGYADEKSWKESFVHVVSDGYFAAMQTPIKRGRDFTPQDVFGKDRVVVINESLAKALWPGQDPIGKFMRTGGVESQVIGVVSDVRHVALEQSSGLEFYLPLRQTGDFSTVRAVFRSQGSASSVAPAIRVALKPVVTELSSDEITVLQDVVDTSVSPRRFMTVLLGGFAAFALLLALLGIYGVISYTVNHRTQEIGVRMALGATARQLQFRIIRETLTLAAVGMLIGTVVSWMLAKTLGGLLFGVSAADPVTFAVMLSTLTVVAIASGYLPARRASRIDPISALRGD